MGNNCGTKHQMGHKEDHKNVKHAAPHNKEHQDRNDEHRNTNYRNKSQ